MPQITPELIAAVQLYCVAKAWTETVRPIVEGYQRKVLYILKPIDMYDGTVITEPKNAYAMPDDDFLLYLRDCNELREKAGLKVPDPEYCPLLMAEHEQSLAEDAIINAAEYFTKVTRDQLLCHHPGIETMHNMTELIIGLVFSYAKDHKIEMNLLKKSQAA